MNLPAVKLKRLSTPGRRRLTRKVSAEAVGEATRQDILRVAAQEFIQHGLEGTSINTIAEKTRGSKRMIYYHFGDKMALYHAVIEDAFERVRAAAPGSVQPADPMAALQQYAVEAFEHFSEHPDFVRLLTHENLTGARVIRSSAAVAEVSRMNIQALEEIVQAGRAAGCMREDFRVLDVFLLVVALSTQPVTNRESIQATLGVDLLGPQEARHRRALLAELVCRYVRP